MGLFAEYFGLYGQRIANAIKNVLNFGAKDAHNSQYNNGNERKNYRVLDKTLALFLD